MKEGYISLMKVHVTSQLKQFNQVLPLMNSALLCHPLPPLPLPHLTHSLQPWPSFGGPSFAPCKGEFKNEALKMYLSFLGLVGADL
jgi:hypothetical protein